MIRAARIFEWIENHLWIRVKLAQPVKDPKTGKVRKTMLRPFHFNSAQVVLAEFVADRWSNGLPLKVLTPKGRQMGSSTFWAGLFFALCVLSPGYAVATVAHQDDGAMAVFSKWTTFEYHLPTGWGQSFKNRQGGRLVWEEDAETGDAGSSAWVETIKTGDGLVKGPTLSAIHFSESGNFADKGVDAANAVASAMNAVADGPETIVIHESTANGRDPYFYPKCEEARDPESLSEYTVLFLPWFFMDEYSMSWREYRARLLGAGKKDPGENFQVTTEEAQLRRELEEAVVAPSERWLRYRYRLSDEQLIWRRWALVNKCESQPQLWSRYYPSTYEEAFQSTVQCLFDQDTIEHYTRTSVDPRSVGDLVRVGPDVLYTSKARGRLKVWEHPGPTQRYVLAGDPGGTRRGADFYAAYVLDTHRLTVCAALHGHMEWDDFAEYLMDLGEYYNWAQIVVERNYNPAIASFIAKEGYPNLYYYVDAAALKGAPSIPGFNTNTKTRPQLEAAIERVTRLKLLKARDVGFAMEMASFVWQEKKKHYAAAGRDKDDRIMAMAMGVFMCVGTEDGVREEEIQQPSWAWKRFQELKRMGIAEESPAGVVVL